jgi:hypothetical protein
VTVRHPLLHQDNPSAVGVNGRVWTVVSSNAGRSLRIKTAESFNRITPVGRYNIICMCSLPKVVFAQSALCRTAARVASIALGERDPFDPGHASSLQSKYVAGCGAFGQHRAGVSP